MTIEYQKIISAQKDIHKKLFSTLKKNSKSQFLRPIPDHQKQIFAQIKNFIETKKMPVILDSGCGTGLSTQTLAAKNPDHIVIGFDKSQARLDRAALSCQKNYLLVRADFVDLWRLLAKEKIVIEQHFLFFPNPWPKPAQLQRRFYAHPSFLQICQVTKLVHMRCNWEIFARECFETLKFLGFHSRLYEKTTNEYFSLFEKKYLENNCPVFIVSGENPNI